MIHPSGRQPLGINQSPFNGSHYPFTNPFSNLHKLIGDFYLTYRDPYCQFVQPFSIAWLRGFGTNGNSASESNSNSEAHSYDLVVTDATDQVVFDSRDAQSFTTRDWGERLRILQWQTQDAICRCTTFLAWSQQELDDNLDVEFDYEFEPEDGELDPRTYERQTRFLRSITASGETLRETTVYLESGYNFTFELTQTAAQTESELLRSVDLTDSGQKPLLIGRRRRNRIRVSAVPGSGAGQAPGCEDVEPVVRSIGGAVGDSRGNVNLDLSGCLWFQRPVLLSSESPRLFQYGTEELGSAEAKASLMLRNACSQNCCDCAYFVRTYKGLKRVWNAWQSIASDAGNARDLLQDNKARWLLERECRLNNPMRVIAIAEPECKLAVGAAFCNSTQCCLHPLIMRFTFRFYRDGELLEAISPGTCSDTKVEGSPHRNGEVPAALIGDWPVFDVQFDYANSQDSSRASFRLCMPNCSAADSVQVVVSVHAPDADDGSECEFLTPEVPEDIQTAWNESALAAPPTVRAIQSSSLIPLNDKSAFCRNCEC